MNKILVQSTNGPIEAIILGQSEINGRSFLVVDIGIGSYVRGVYSKFAVIPAHLVINKNIEDIREVVSERPQDSNNNSIAEL